MSSLQFELKYVKRRLWGLHGGARSVRDEAPLPSGAFGCSASKPPFPLVGDRKQIPLVRGQLVAYSCPSVHVHSLPPSVDPPQPPFRQKILHYRADLARKWSPPSVHRTLVADWRTYVKLWLATLARRRLLLSLLVVLVEALRSVIWDLKPSQAIAYVSPCSVNV